MDFNKKTGSLMVLSLVGISSSAMSQPSTLPSIVTLSIGPTWQAGGRTQTLLLAPDIEKTYTADNQVRSLTTG